MKTAFLLLAMIFSVKGFASIAGLSPEALACYEAVADEENSDVLKMSRDYAATKLESIIIGMCTYSNAKGALKCFRDAMADDKVLTAQKQVVNTVALEQKYARLCSNTRIGEKFPKTKDVDAVECVKAVMDDSAVFKSKKNFALASEVEEEAVALCISSNAKGATTCFKNGMKEKVRLFGENIDYKTAGRLEKSVAALCKGSRL